MVPHPLPERVMTLVGESHQLMLGSAVGLSGGVASSGGETLHEIKHLAQNVGKVRSSSDVQ